MAWGLRHAPRVGLVLGAVTLLGSVGVIAGGEWAGSDAPWWPALGAFPVEGSAWADAVFVACAVACGALLVVELVRRRGELRL
jgi:polyferredoxin